MCRGGREERSRAPEKGEVLTSTRRPQVVFIRTRRPASSSLPPYTRRSPAVAGCYEVAGARPLRHISDARPRPEHAPQQLAGAPFRHNHAHRDAVTTRRRRGIVNLREAVVVVVSLDPRRHDLELLSDVTTIPGRPRRYYRLFYHHQTSYRGPVRKP